MVNDKTLALCQEWSITPKVMALIIVLINGPINESSLYPFIDAILESKELGLVESKGSHLMLTAKSLDFCKILLGSFNDNMN